MLFIGDGLGAASHQTPSIWNAALRQRAKYDNNYVVSNLYIRPYFMIDGSARVLQCDSLWPKTKNLDHLECKHIYTEHTKLMSWQLDGTTLCADTRAHAVPSLLQILEVNG